MNSFIPYKTIAAFCLCSLSITGGAVLAANENPVDSISTEEFQILHHESINFYQTPLISSEDETGARRAALHTGSFNLTFDAYGQQFNLEVEPNKRLLDHMPEDKQKGYAAMYMPYRGKIVGIDDSWVRLTRIGEYYAGAIWDGNELYSIEPSAALAASLDEKLHQKRTYQAVYAMSDVINNGKVCGMADPSGAGHTATNFPAMVSHLKSTAAATATSQLNMSIVTDVQFNQQNAGNVEAAAIARMNIVDGIFSEQVGVHLNIADIVQLQSDRDINTNNSSGVLDGLSNLVRSGQVTNPGLTHLFTGRNIDGGVIGVAYLNVVCANNSVGVGFSQNDNRTSVTLGALTAAHEIGHNFGAPHDNQGGSACSGTAGTFLMNPIINGSDTFSQCSLSQMEREIREARCLVAVSEPTPPAPTPPAPTPPAPTPPAPTPPAPTPPAPTPPAPGPDLAADFDKNADGFSFLRDPETPRYSYGRRLSRVGVGRSGALAVSVGGVDNADITDITGSWSTRFSGAGNASLSIDTRLAMHSDYESDEYVEARVRIDGELFTLLRITGDGNGGPHKRTRYRQFNQELKLAPGKHTVTLECFNNKKTYGNERSICLFDNLTIK